MARNHTAAIDGIDHHAIHLQGSVEDARVLANALAERDVVHFAFDSLGIDESREIRIASLQGPSKGSHRFIVISFTRATLEAQNALLKALEDPPLTTRFILVSPDFDSLIETVRSRLYALDGSLSTQSDREFLHASVGERIEMMQKAIDAKDFSKLRQVVLSAVAGASLLTPNERRTAQSVASKVLSELSGRSPSPKLLMEYFALRMPKIGAK